MNNKLTILFRETFEILDKYTGGLMFSSKPPKPGIAKIERLYNSIQEELHNTINAPCKTGDYIWFIDDDGKLQWADVVAFTETQIIVDTAWTKGRPQNLKEKLPINEWGKTILKTDSREEAEKKFIELGFKDI